MMPPRKQTLAFAVACALTIGVNGPALAQQPAAEPPAAELNEQEQAFVDLLSGSTLVGRFTVDGQEDRGGKSERYTIRRVMKVAGDDWIIEAQITYGQTDVPLPVPVQVHWAGDTPMISVTDLELPVIGGQFTSRVMFHGDRYAGTWQHNQVGGHMLGTIERPDETAADEASPQNGDE